MIIMYYIIIKTSPRFLVNCDGHFLTFYRLMPKIIDGSINNDNNCS